jgi:probable phosphoglycerate mutase
MTLVILARHGNTFETGQEAVWVGARTDLPLTSKGREQAAAIGEALRRAGLIPARTLAGPLKRTRETASLALETAGAPLAQIEIDEGLREIDYGDWEGKSSAAIRQAGGGPELDAWEHDGTWPAGANWPLSREIYLKNFSDIIRSVREANRSPTFIVSSNGLFRLLANSVAGRGFSGKMATGRLGLLRIEGDGAILLLGWNLVPDDFPACVAEHRSR